MKVSYIYHSGFLIETERDYYIFDYYKGEVPELDHGKNVWVFASHCHKDHYNKEIFDILKKQGIEKDTIHAILSKDIFRKNYPTDIEVTTVRAHERHELANGTVVETLLSTDLGVAFYVTTNEGTIFHAGDLNDWRWEENLPEENRVMVEKYRSEIDKIADRTPDVAFVPLDPRQEKDYFGQGFLYFLQKVKAKTVYPMHYWEKPEVIREFLEEYPQYGEVVQFTE